MDYEHRARVAAQRLARETEFYEDELYRAARAVIAAGDPPRDRLVIERVEARRAAHTPRATKAWAMLMALMDDATPPATFDLWVHPLRLIGESASGAALVVEGPAPIVRWVKRRYSEQMREFVIAATDFEDLVIRPTKGD